MMHMTFYWSKNVTLLFSSWNTHSWPDYLLTLLACFLFSVFHQFMEDRRLQFKSIATAVPNPSSVGTPLILKLGPAPARVATSVLFGINSGIGYFLMLAIMSFNGGVLLAVVVGLSVGYYFFRSGDDTVLVVDNSCGCS